MTPPALDNVADLYGLTPMQEGMLFHTVADPGSGVFVGQFAGDLHGDLDVSRFKAAWSAVVARHAALRTQFAWEDLDEPLQVVRDIVDVPWREDDWQDLEKGEREQRWQTYLDDDRQRGVDPSHAPMMRMALIRTADRTWRWLWTSHHLISDGWSTAVLLEEVFAIYIAKRGGDAPALGTPVPYRAYVEWHAEQDRVEAESFWRRTLAGFTSPTRLVAPRGASPRAGHRRVHRPIPAETARGLQAFARTHQVTESTIVQGMWALLLSRCARERDVVFGVTTSGRPPVLEGIERAVGVFINTLPLRVNVDETQAIAGWLRGVQSAHIEVRRWEYSALADVQRLSDLPPRVPLFESILVVENYPGVVGEVPAAAGLELRSVAFIEESNYPLAILYLPGAAPASVFVYDRAHFDEETIASLSDALAYLLEQVASDALGSLADLELVRPETPDLAANEFDAPPPDNMLPTLMMRRAETDPDAAALIGPSIKMTYRELRDEALRLADRLRATGVGPNVCVGLLGARSVETALGIVAIHAAGGAYVPLDPAHPAAHLRGLIDDAKLPVVLTTAALAPSISDSGVGVVTFGETTEDVAPGAVPAPCAPDDLAYVMHTSGTTGRPKGVMVTHGNLAHSTAARNQVYGAGPARFLLLSSFAFDSSVAGIFWTLGTGGTLVIPPDRLEQDMHGLAALIAERAVTHLLALPALYRLLLETARPDQLATLDTVIVAGERCPPDVVGLHHKRFPGVRLFNEYGPTEASVWATVHETTPADAAGPVPIGRAIPRMRVDVLGPDGRPVPTAIAGEVHLAGAGVARGYLHDDALTRSRFTTRERDGRTERLYRTGDLASRRGDGTLLFLGRADTQVKVRGHRLETTGLETRLRARSDVADALVETRTSGSANATRLVAYVVPMAAGTQNGTVETTRLHDDLRERWPAFMVPDDIVMVSAFPRLANGKIDRRALPDPRPRAAGPRIAPRDDIEETLAALWRDVLGVDAVGIHDDFFALGGDSIVSIRLMSRIEDRYGRRLPLAMLLERGTIAALATAIRSGEPGETGSLVPIRSTGTRAPLFCVHAGGGYVLEYQHLAARLDRDRPVFGLQPVGLDGRCPPMETIEAMATHYIEAMKNVQATGPYVLVGHCVGATVCFEMTRQLQAAGASAALLVVLDAGPPGGGGQRSIATKALNYTKIHGKRTLRRGARRLYRTIERASYRRLRRIWELRFGSAERRRLAHIELVRQACQRAYLAYNALPCDVPILQIRSSEHAEMLGKEKHLGWNRLSSDVDLHVVPARHRTMLLEPEVAEVARLVSERLARLDGGEA